MINHSRFLLFIFLAYLFAADVGYAQAPVNFVKDGDSFVLNGREIRLWGIDAVEFKQSCLIKEKTYPCGQYARNFFVENFNPEEIKCEAMEQNPRDTRLIAKCLVNGRDLGEMIVQSGWAIDYTYFSGGYYQKAQGEAKSDKRGIWAGEFIEPYLWRRQQAR